MFRYNPKGNYQPNGGRYLQILSGKDLAKGEIRVVLSQFAQYFSPCFKFVVDTTDYHWNRVLPIWFGTYWGS